MGYQIFIEPEKSPIDTIFWISYRPDVFGFTKEDRFRRYSFIECETNPSDSRFIKKNWQRTFIQTKLFEETNVSHILATTFGRISNITRLRLFWEIWLINMSTKEICKFPICKNN